QKMLKRLMTVHDLGSHAADTVRARLGSVPPVRIEKAGLAPPESKFEILVGRSLDDRSTVLVCEVQPIALPRVVRAALLRLQKAASSFDPPATPIFIAPYLSAEAQSLCREFAVGFVDLVGNARIAFDTVFIERQVDAKPPAVQRSL